MSCLDSICAVVHHNIFGWGPKEEYFSVFPKPEPAIDLIVSKGEQFGQTADWSIGLTQDRRVLIPIGSRRIQFTVFEEGPNFQYVQTPRSKRSPAVQRSLKHKLQQQKVLQMQKQQREEKHQANISQNVKQRKLREREIQKAEKKWFKNYGSRYQQQRYNNMRKIAPSVEIKSTWQVIREIEFSSLNKLNVIVSDHPEDLRDCGFLEYYDVSFDRLSPKTATKLLPADRDFYKPSTSNDPVMNEFFESSVGQVYATDTIIATLMTCTRSVYPWDIVVIRKGSRIYLDKRENSNLDMLTVNENSSEPPQDYFNLGSESSLIDKYFSQQVIKRDKTVNAKHPIPFHNLTTKQHAAAILYKYRLWNVKEVPIIIRCEVNAMLSENLYCSIRTLNEYDPKITDDWRRKLELQKGAVIATELKNNSNKLAKYAISSILAGCDLIKLGYISRENFYSPKSHVILGTQDFVPSFLASQVSLDLNNCWGILYVLIQECLKLNEGKYIIIKDSSKPILRIYQTMAEGDVSELEDEDSDSHSDKSVND